MNRVVKPFSLFAYWLSWPALYIKVNGSRRTRVLIIYGEKVLLTKGWINDGKWALPGGGLNKNESPKDGALREIEEETGLVLDKSQLIILTQQYMINHGIKFFGYFFVVRLNEQSEAKRHSEIMETVWMDVASVDLNNTNREVLMALELARDN